MKKIITTSHKPLILMIIGFGVGVFLFWAGLALAQGNFGLNDLSNTGLGTRDIKDIVTNIVNIVLGFLTSAAVILFIYGGYTWMTAGGNEEKIAKAKKILTNTAIGLAIVLSSYGIARFVILQFVDGSGSGAGGEEKSCYDQVGPNMCNGGCIRCISSGGTWKWAQDTSCNPNMCGLPSSSFRVNWVYPTDGQKDVSLCSIIQAKFTGNLNEGTINSTNIKIKNKTTGADLDGKFSCPGPGGAAADCGADQDKGNWFKFDPTADYDSGTDYEVEITSEVKEDVTGIAVEPKAWTFTTGSTTDITPPTVKTIWPEDGKTDVCRNTPIQAGFSEAMDISTINTATVGLKDDLNNPVVLAAPFDFPNIDFFTASQKNPPLAENKAHQVKLTGAEIKDTCGNSLDGNANGVVDTPPADDYKWGFTTGEVLECKPTITKLTPVTGYHDTVVVIDGENFFGGGNVKFNSGVLDVGNCFNIDFWPKQNCLDAWTSSQIKVRVPAGGGTSGGAIDGPVKVLVGKESNEAYFDNESPHLNWISPLSGGVGQYVTISGSNFGSTKGVVNFIRESDGMVVPAGWPPNPCPDTWSDDQIIVMVPYGFSKDDKLELQVINNEITPDSGKHSNRMDFTFNNEPPGPGICSLSDTCGSAGEEVTITGERFGASQGGNNVLYKTTIAASYPKWSATEIRSVSNSGLANDNYSIVVNVSGKTSNTLFYRIPCGQVPAVVEKTECDEGNHYPSPAPRPNETNACANTAISALFTEDMLDSDLIQASKIKIIKCNEGENYNDSDCNIINRVVPVSLTRIPGGVGHEGFTFIPDVNLSVNTWYRGTIDKSMKAASGAKMANDYTWHFKTRAGSDKCPVETVNVNPVSAEITVRSGQAPFSAVALNNCVELVSTDYDWAWFSSNTRVATMASTTDPSASATAAGLGNTLIKAETEGKNNQSRLDVNYCDASTDCTQSGLCPGSVCDLDKKKCTPAISSFNPADGDIGTWTTISGCYFGSAKGNVKFHDNKDSAWPDPGSCGDTWTDTSIQAEVPTGADDGKIKVIRADGASAESSSNFDVNSTNYPGLCRISPNSGKFNDEVTLIGKNFGALKGGGSVEFKGTSGRVIASIKTWADKMIKGFVPFDAQTTPPGEGVKVIQTNPSNPLDFTVSQTCSSCQNDSNCPVPGQACSIAAGCCVDRPTFNSFIPPIDSTGACRNVTIKMTSSRLMDPASFQGGNLVVKYDDGTLVDGVITTSDNPAAGETTVSFDPNGSLTKNSLVIITIKKDVLSKDGVAMSATDDFTWRFTTINRDSDCSDCGNGVVGPGEECDDGNITDGDGCSSSCRLELGGGGQVCKYEAASCPAGAGGCRPDYNCAPGAGADCRCCCTPGVASASGLKCTADVSPCSGASRGLYCGCTADSQCAGGAEGCGTGNPRCCYARPSLIEKSPTAGSQEECRNTIISGNFDEKMNPDSLKDPNNILIEKIGSAGGVGGEVATTETGFTFNPLVALDGNADYQVTIKGDPDLQDAVVVGVKNDKGVGMAGNFIWSFKTKNEICQIDRVEINKQLGQDQPFTSAGQFTIYRASARDKNGNNLNADYSWAIDDQSIATINPQGGFVMVEAQAKNGKTTLRVTADGTAHGGTGRASNSTGIEVFLCGSRTLWEYPDGATDTNFKLKYCMENGLPNFDKKREVPGSGDLLKEFFFTRTSGCDIKPKPASCDDAIGVRVMKNLEHLSPLNWYRAQFPSGGSPARTTVGGYEAVQDGRTIYVAATNLAGGTLYTNIYLISYNDKADASTAAVYNELVKNWTFNANEGDFGGSLELVKVQRDTKRLTDLLEAKASINNYYASTALYPILESGSYLKYLSTSVWPSWQETLGKALGRSLPTDPLNDIKCDSCQPLDKEYKNKTYGGLDIDDSGNVFIVDYFDSDPPDPIVKQVVERCNADLVNCKDIFTGLDHPEGLGLDKTNGDLLIAETGASRILRLKKDQNDKWSRVDTIDNAGALEVISDYNGNIFFVTPNHVYKYSNNFDTLMGSYEIPAATNPPGPPVAWGLGVDKDNNIYVATRNVNKILKLNNDLTQVLDSYGDGNASEQYTHDPLGVDVDQDGQVYVVEYNGQRAFILDKDMTNKVATFGVYTISGSDKYHLNLPYRIKEFNNYVYITDRINKRVIRLKKGLSGCGACWNEANKSFQCSADGTHIYQYKFTVGPPPSANLYAHFEYAGIGSWINYDIHADNCAGYPASNCACFNYKL